MVDRRAADDRRVVRPWTDDEPDFRIVVDEVRRLVRRGLKRKLIVLFVTLAALGVMLGRQATRARTYPARVVLSATEGVHVEGGPVYSNEDLKSYIGSAVLIDSQLIPVLKKHKFQTKLLESSPQKAIESFREDLEIDVSKNEFGGQKNEAIARSALITLEIWLPDPDQGLGLLRELGELVIARDMSERKARMTITRNATTDKLTAAQVEQDRLQRELTMANLEMEGAEPGRFAELRVKAATLERSIVDSRLRMQEAEEAKRAVSVLEARHDTIRWDFVDLGSAALKVDERIAMIKTAIVGFLLLLPLILIGVGAFDRTVWDDRDVGYMGIVALGTVKTVRTRMSS